MRRRKQIHVADFVEKHEGNVKIDGFYWRDPATDEFCAVILAKSWHRTTAEEFRGDTPGALVETIKKSNCDPGTPDAIRDLCESAPRWRLRDKRRDRSRRTPTAEAAKEPTT